MIHCLLFPLPPISIGDKVSDSVTIFSGLSKGVSYLIYTWFYKATIIVIVYYEPPVALIVLQCGHVNVPRNPLSINNLFFYLIAIREIQFYSIS